MNLSREETVKHQFESPDELDRLDSAVASREGYLRTEINSLGKAVRSDQTPYQPTRDAAESFRLMEKYVIRMSFSKGVWCAVAHNGRAYSGRTALIAICRAAADYSAVDSTGEK